MDENGNNFNYNSEPPQGQYSQPSGYNIVQPPQSEMTLKDWVITLLILAIPCVGFIMLLVWAFSSGNETRSNFCKAYLIAGVIITVLIIILSIISGAAIASMIASMGRYYY